MGNGTTWSDDSTWSGVAIIAIIILVLVLALAWNIDNRIDAIVYPPAA